MGPKRLGFKAVLLSLLALTPAMALAQQSHLNHARGFNPNQVYNVYDLDSVNVFNGNLVLGLPIGSTYRVGGSLSYSLKLFYNSNLWSYSEVGPSGGPNVNYNYMTVWVTRFANNTSGGGGCCYQGATWSVERFIPNDSDIGPRSASGDSSHTVAFPNPNANAGLGWQMTLGNLFEPRAQEDSFDPQTTDQMLWTYQAPDGSEHQFYSTLHEDDPKVVEDANPVTDSITYTRDGSFLRMKVVNPTTRTIESPDGTTHTLQNLAPPPQGGLRFSPYWAVTRMADRFGNAVNVTYHIARDAQQRVISVQWEISDGLRTNYVNLQRFEEAPEVGPVIRSVDLEGFDGQRNTYNFEYDVRTIRRAWPNVEDSPVVNVNVTVPFLKYVRQPDESRYSMEPVDEYYDVTGTQSNTRYRGVLRKLTLPTGARLEWDYKPETPGAWDPSDPNLFNYGYAYPMMSTGRNYLRRNYGGVRVRRLVEGGNTYTWRYDPKLEPQPPGCSSPSANAPCAHQVFKSRVTTPQGDYTWHYFSVYPFPHDSDVGRQPADWHVAEYGLPLRKDVSKTMEDGSPVFLSSEVYDSGGTKLRETYVRFETDKLTQRDPWGAVVANGRRLLASKTFFLDDTEFGTKYTEEMYSDYDGLGHLRVRETEGNFASADRRFEKTDYNDARGTYLIDPATNQPAAGHNYTPFPESSPWVLNTHSSMLQREGNNSAMQQFNFNSLGQLIRKRVMRNNGGAGAPSPAGSDLLTVYGYNADGTLLSEDYYGGDLRNDLGNNAITGALPATGSEYRINHTYQHKQLKTSMYRGSNFYTYDVDVDRATGLVRRSRDVSKFWTDYAYDGMWRPTTITPASGNRTDILYEPLTGGAVGGTPKAIVKHSSNDGATLLDQEEYEYDNLGRVKVEKKMMPGGGFIARQTLYNGMGWVTSRSEWQAWTPGMNAFSHKTVYSDYDPFGRARLVTPPDGAGHAVRYDYRGVREVKKTVNVANTFSGGVSAESAVVSYQGYDRQGRFGSVEEGSGAGGGLVKTTYLYDVGGRLRQAATSGLSLDSGRERAGQESETEVPAEDAPATYEAATGTAVTQTRVFTYDNRGLLSTEKLPEVGVSGNGTISYGNYDSMGRVGSKRDGVNKLRYDYDSAGRLTRLRECLTDFMQCEAAGNSRPVKEYAFHNADQSASGIYELGKLASATRHNYLLNPYDSAAADATVTESYQYRETGARLSRRRLDTNTGVGFQQTFDYDELGQMLSQSYPRCYTGYCAGVGPARTVSYTYDRGLLTGVPGYAKNILYHPNGMMGSAERVNNSGNLTVTETYGKDQNNIQRARRITLSGSEVNWTTGDYKYDGAGNVKGIGADWYVYDGANRLVEGTALNTTNNAEKKKQTYKYDPFGNITQREDFAYVGTPSEVRTGVSQPDILSGINRFDGIPYDASGNATGESWSAGIYKYDALNMMKVSPGKIYIYDANDERVWVLDHSSGNTFYYVNTFTLRGAGNEALREYTQVGYNTSANAWAWGKDYVRGGGRLLASESAAGRLNYHTDHLGTPRVITNMNGVAVSKHNYLPFGEEATNPGQDYERLKFTGHERETNHYPGHPMDYMHARYYLYGLGKFMSVDPGRDWDPAQPQSWNLYAYTRNNPLNRTDPTGRAGQGAFAAAFSFASQVSAAAGSTPRITPDLSGVPAEYLGMLQGALSGVVERLTTIKSCAYFFNGGNPQGALENALKTLSNTKYIFRPLKASSSEGYTGAGTTQDNKLVLINQNGPFVNNLLLVNHGSNIERRTLDFGTGFNQEKLRELMLLHELGHQTDIFGPDAQFPALNRHYTQLVLETCFGFR